MTDNTAGEFTLTLIDEAVPTVDGRIFEPGVVTWREPPLPLMYLTENIGDGHKGSRVGASITEIWRDGSKIVGRGRFDSGEAGQELRRMISEGTLNGVSADVGGATLEQELAEDGTNRSRIMRGRIMGATVLPFPAFDDTRIAVVASAVPTEPPTAWFQNPHLAAPTPLTITRDGQVFGHAALWGTCHTGRPGTCLTAPRSSTDYAYFRTGAVLTADGDTIATGPITLGTGHAGLSLNSRSAAEHYDHTGTAIADVVTGEDAFGIWFAGAVRPGIPDERLHALRASALSGDWRAVNGKLELVALLAVNTPGFPVPRTSVALADESDPLALVAAGVVTTEEFQMETKMGTGGELKKDPHHNHNDPTSMDNETDETPRNRPEDENEEEISEANAKSKRDKVGEFGSSKDDEEEDDTVECAECGDSEVAVITDVEFSEEDVELAARIEALENAVVALAAQRFTTA